MNRCGRAGWNRGKALFPQEDDAFAPKGLANQMDMTIRKALPEDAADYATCLISCWQSAYRGIVPDDYLNDMSLEKEQRIEKSRKTLQDPGDCEIYCLTHAEQMIGFLIIHKGGGEIWAIYLVDEFCGKEYGKEMLNFAITKLAQMGHKTIFLWVFEENNRARRFYEKHNLSF